MKLRTYIAEKKLSIAAFGRSVGVENRMTMSRYVKEERIPPKRVILRIAEATDNAVGPADYYDDSERDAVA